MSMWQDCLHFRGTTWRHVISLTKSPAEGWKDAFYEELSCFYMFPSKGLDWTSGTLWLTEDLPRIYKCSFANYKRNCCTVQIFDTFWGIHYSWKWSHTDPTSQSTFWFLSNFWKTKYFAEHLLMPRSCSKLSVRLSNYHLAWAIACWGLHNSREVNHI